MTGFMALARVEIDGKDSSIIVIAEADRKLRAYHYSAIPDTVWESTDTWVNGQNARAETCIGVADFNADGHAEIYTGNRIFNASTGEFLCAGTGNEGMSTDPNDAGGYHAMTVAADIFNTGKLNLVAGNQVYEVADDLLSMTVVASVTPPNPGVSGVTVPNDGLTQVIDIDNDGRLEVVVEKRINTNQIIVYVWSPHTKTVLAYKYLTTNVIGIPFIGDVDGDRKPEILFITNNDIHAYKYEEGNPLLQLFWTLSHTDGSAMTGLTLFDFNQDGIAEIVYRDEKELRIINGSKISHKTEIDTIVYALKSYPCFSGTGYEYPVVADIDDDGSAEILIAGNSSSGGNGLNGPLRVFRAGGETKWAPARKVWNQYAYNAVNVNEDLTVPRYPLSPAITLPGTDSIIGTADDVRPYNNFLQQQTALSLKGTALWLTPDAVPVSGSITVSNNKSATVTVSIENRGDAAIGSPVYVSLYKDSVSAQSYILTDTIYIQINFGETKEVNIPIDDITKYPAIYIVARVNDNVINNVVTDEAFPYQPECDTTNNELPIFSLNLYMEKHAKLIWDGNPPFEHDGWYANPISVLNSERIEYRITVVNPVAGKDVIIRDTLPPYLEYVKNSATPAIVNEPPLPNGGNPPQEVLLWKLTGIPQGASSTVTFKANTASGANASQPLYINRAWVDVTDTATFSVPTNSTYHQGAGTSTVTFSAGYGGSIYNADPQVLDYSTTARAGVLVVPDEGYEFAGWSHDAYTSHRGKHVAAHSGIMYYDTLVIYGNVELRADFSLNRYPIRYYLNDGENSETNPVEYTVKSAAITLAPPRKPGDVFTGWTGSNGEDPQETLTIPAGSTGDRVYYANFLYSGRETAAAVEETTDKIWSFAHEVFIRTSLSGSIARIYTPDGVLRRQHTILAPGTTKLSLAPGVYIITLNNHTASKIVIGEQ
jgi:uncharacterized repeat protein (TIGR02543 family)/uncharacterized repeat protein (TIGR01451 family)